jgi:hypothetical protein
VLEQAAHGDVVRVVPWGSGQQPAHFTQGTGAVVHRHVVLYFARCDLDGIAKECDAITDTIKDKFKEAGIDFSTFNLDIKETILKVFNKEIAF